MISIMLIFEIFLIILITFVLICSNKVHRDIYQQIGVFMHNTLNYDANIDRFLTIKSITITYCLTSIAAAFVVAGFLTKIIDYRKSDYLVIFLIICAWGIGHLFFLAGELYFIKNVLFHKFRFQYYESSLLDLCISRALIPFVLLSFGLLLITLTHAIDSIPMHILLFSTILFIFSFFLRYLPFDNPSHLFNRMMSSLKGFGKAIVAKFREPQNNVSSRFTKACFIKHTNMGNNSFLNIFRGIILLVIGGAIFWITYFSYLPDISFTEPKRNLHQPEQEIKKEKIPEVEQLIKMIRENKEILDILLRRSENNQLQSNIVSANSDSTNKQ